MTITPTPVTAALAGVFSALVWPLVWSRFGDTASSGSFELVVATLLVIALPAHAFVVGFSGARPPGARGFDKALLIRIGAWLGAAALAAGALALRGT